MNRRWLVEYIDQDKVPEYEAIGYTCKPRAFYGGGLRMCYVATKEISGSNSTI